MANGIIIIDKPAGWTSMDVCAKLRGILKTKKVGHAGTLDPMATGVLPVFVGQATRAVSFAEDGQKEYIAGLRLGRTTDTQDTSGETLDTHPVLTGREDLEHLLPRFTGPIEQVPPMYSAIKIGGQKLYQIARRGGEGAAVGGRRQDTDLQSRPLQGGPQGSSVGMVPVAAEEVRHLRDEVQTPETQTLHGLQKDRQGKADILPVGA